MSHRSWIAVCCVAFALISALMLAGVFNAMDRATLQWMLIHRGPEMTSFMQAMSLVGEWQIEVPLLLIFGGWIATHGHRSAGLRYIGSALSGEAIYALLKILFHRPRPTLIPHLGKAGWYSYPSGHAMLAVIIFGGGSVVLARILPVKWQRTIVAAGCLITLAVAVSRVYLGVHYPSDVLGALAAGLAWCVMWLRPQNSVATPS